MRSLSVHGNHGVGVALLPMWAEALKGHLDGLLLAALADGPLHGYAVKEALREGSGGTFDLPTGTVYPALHRLERSGLIRSDWSTVGGRRRRTYELTEAGERTLGEERTSWRRFAAAMTAMMDGVPSSGAVTGAGAGSAAGPAAGTVLT